MAKNNETRAGGRPAAPAPSEGIHRKLAWIQANLSAPKERRNATNPELEYRNIEDICAAAGPLLEEAGCSLTFDETLHEKGGRVYVASRATLADENGEGVSCTAYAREDDALPDMCGAQITGACTSYARKYAAAGLFALGSGRRLAPPEEIDALDQKAAAEVRKKGEAGEKAAVPSPVRSPYATQHPILMPGFSGWTGEVKKINEWRDTREAYLRDLGSRYAYTDETLCVLLSQRKAPFLGE